ncbi:MAG: TetR/AcrR family transcriptional regulator [Candidatus Zixiibacteriota bacterium]
MSLNENLIAELVERKTVADAFRRLQPAKKDQIYRAAVRLFGRYGYDGLSVDFFCSEAGISKGSFFQYFPSKSHLLEFTVLVFDDYLSALVAEVRRNEKAVMARDRLEYLHHSLAVNSRLHPAEEKFFLFATGGLHHARVILEGVDLRRYFEEYIFDIIERGVETREVRDDIPAAITAELVSIMLGGLVSRHYAGEQTRRRQTYEFLFSFLFDGIKRL